VTEVNSIYHAPVLGNELVAAAAGAQRVVDGTLGGGGHAALFRQTGAEVLGIDRDPDALAAARKRLGEPGMRYLQTSYASDEALEAIRQFSPEFILLDLGVSSHQLDQDERGFSFRLGAPLDMRMSQSGPTAADLLNRAPESELREIFAEYGDEPRAARLAREIVRRRGNEAFAISDHLVNAIRAVRGPQSGPGDFARLFQAVRIALNGELLALAKALPEMRDALRTGGRLAVISYHSGEDRIVKHTFQDWARQCICPPEAPLCTCRGRPLGRIEPRKAIRPGDTETSTNPRARSATLRIFRKIEV
jgi:16S rRNA (cytosine1402-N4)-methyltransferase